MTISFKQFAQLVDLNEDEFIRVGEGLSDLPGFGWLKGKDNSEKLAKISAERAKLKGKRDEKSKAMDAEFAKIKAKLDAGGGKKSTLSSDDLEKSMTSTDRKFHAKDDARRDANAAHVRKNLGIEEGKMVNRDGQKMYIPSKEDDRDGQGAVTIQGRKGMKSTPFEKTFKNQSALDKWMEKHGGDVSIDKYSYARTDESMRFNVFGILISEDHYDSMDPKIARQNKRAAEFVEMLKKAGIKAKLVAEGDYDTDPEISCGKAEDGRDISATVQQNGKYSFSRDDGDEFEFSPMFSIVGAAVTAIAKVAKK